jgi:NitT/TauT family transport system permease protein
MASSSSAARLSALIFSRKFWRGVVSIVSFLVIWEIGSRSREWIGVPLPWISQIPAPSAVAATFLTLVHSPSYWYSWYLSTARVFEGFIAAMLIGIPLGLAMAVSRTFYGTFFPVFEVLRPIPPLAWVPASIIFWPTQEMSIAFVTFLGAFYAIVINVIGGAQAIDVRYFQAARSMGSSG